MASRPVFPKKFLWGASISPHQVEGGQHNQWSEWEKQHAKTLATQAPYHFGQLDNWDDIKRLATLPANYISARAVDHYNRYEEDFDLARNIGLNTLRVGIEWSRIEPEEGSWDAAAIEHYRRYLTALKDRQLEPVVTLFHFTLPVWFAEMGGFEKAANIKYFTRYVQKIIDELGGQMRYIITINEPGVYAAQSYHEANWPPAKQSKFMTVRVLHNLIKAHNRAARLIRQSSRRYQVSMAYNWVYIYAGDDAKLSEWSAKLADYMTNHYVLRRTIKTSTYIGLNYYFSNRIYGYRVHNPNTQLNDLGWDMQPQDIRLVLEEISDRYHKPILITENGLADASDEKRVWWLSETLRAVSTAMTNGVSVMGYLHWSLTDNLEWNKGRWPRFGLVEVDYRNLQRKLRPSAGYYARLITKLTKEGR